MSSILYSEEAPRAPAVLQEPNGPPRAPDEPPGAVATAAPGPPDTTDMTHKERLAALKAYRLQQENGHSAQATAEIPRKPLPTWVEPVTGERPSSRVLKPPGGASNFTFG